MSKPTTSDDASVLLLAFSRRLSALLQAGPAPPEFSRAALEALAGAAGCDRARLWVRDDEDVVDYVWSRSGGDTACAVSRTEGGRLPEAASGARGVLVPLDSDGERVGVLELDAPSAGPEVTRAIASTLALGLARHASRHALRERVKELTCLSELVRLAAEPHRDLDELLAGMVRLLPPAWQYPDVAEAAILFDGRSFATEGYDAVQQRQRADILVDGKHRGHVELGYREPRPPAPEGPFLRQERRLIDTIASDIGLIAKRLEEQQRRGELEQQLRHADRLATIGQLAAGVAHELNEPLANILGYAQLARKAEGLPEQAARDLDRAVQGALYARDILRRLLQFARQTQVGPATSDLHEAIRELVAFLEPRWRRDRVVVECRLSGDAAPVALHRVELQQVLMNLLVNAAQAMPQGGRLVLRTEVDGNLVRLRVEDSGVGMAESVRRRIFLPFFTTKTPEEGTGLGLATVHDIVTARGGSIAVRSEPGRGTCFDIELPRGEADHG